MKSAARSKQLLLEVLSAVVLTVAAVWLVQTVFASIRYQWKWDAIWRTRQLILQGWWMTVVVSAGALVLSVIIGLVLMLGQRSAIIPVRQLCRAVVELVRGMPLLVLLLLGYYGVANAFRYNEALPVAIVLLALFEGAYLAEIFRGAWESIGASQLESARAVGFDRWQTWRFVVFPQAFRRALPGTAGQLVSLVKDSSLLSTIAVQELTQAVRSANSQSYTALEGYVPLAVLYLVLTLPISWWARRLEGKFRYET